MANGEDPMPYFTAAQKYAVNQVQRDQIKGTIESYYIGQNKAIKQSENNNFQTIVNWMYKNTLTSFTNVEDFNPEGQLTREQAAKIFTQFNVNVLGKETDNN